MMNKKKWIVTLCLVAFAVTVGVWWRSETKRRAYEARWNHAYERAHGDVVRLRPDHPLFKACSIVRRLQFEFGDDAVKASCEELDGVDYRPYQNDEEGVLDAPPFYQLHFDASWIYVYEREEKQAERCLMLAETLQEFMLTKFKDVPFVSTTTEQHQAWDAGRMREAESKVGPRPPSRR